MFKITQRLNNPKYSWYERGEAKIKYSIYSVMHELLQCQIAFPMFFNLLLIIETFQFLWYAIHPDYDFLWTTTFSNYPRDIIKFFQFDGLLREGDKSTYFAILYICFAVQLLMLICLIIVLILLERAKKKSISIVFYTLRLLSFYVLLLTTIAPIPLTDIFMVAIICKDGEAIRGSTACYTGVNLINLGVGIFGLLTTIVFAFLSQLLFIDMNPSSNIPFAAPQSNTQLMKLLLKFALPIYIVLDGNPDATKDLAHANVFVGLFCIASLLVLVLRYNSQGYYNSTITLFAVFMESWVFWATIVATIHAFLDNENVDDTGLYYFLFASPFAAMTYYKIFTHQRKGLLQSNIRKFTKAIQFEKYLNLIIHLADNIEFEGNRIELEGVLRYHVKFCKNEFGTCPCVHMASMIPKEDEEPAEIKKTWYEFIRSVLGDGNATFNKSARLHLQHAYFQQEKLHNRYKALFELSITEEYRPSIQEEFSVFRYRNIIEKEMIEDDIRNTDIRGLDVNLIVHFQGKLVALQGEIGKAVNMQLDFWRELEQTNPNVQKLLHLGSRITIQGDIVKTSYSKLSELNSNHIRMLKLYGNFLKDILHDKFEAARVLENAEYAERSVKNFMDNERMKYSENSKTCIITCSGNLQSMGKVLSANNESMDVLQYVHTDLIGQSINAIMPNIIADIHDDLMKRYFETNEARVMGRERLIFPMTRAGYIVPCNLMIKIFPNLDEGIRVVGFLRKIDSKNSEEASHRTHYVIYGGDENDIYGVSQNCFESFGIPASLTTGETKDFTITSILPDLMNQNMEELKSTTGLVCTIDTTTLEQNFLIDRQDSEVNEEDDETKQRRYRSSKVRVVLLSEDLYLGKHSVKILKFVEHGDAETKVAKSDVVNNEQENQKKDAAGEGGSQETDMDVSRSEGSSVSVGSSIGEDSRQLKDMKAKITEKNIPSSISALQRYSLVFIIGLIIITGVQLGKRSSMHDDLWYGLSGTRLGYDRYGLLPYTSFELRVLDLLAENLLDATLYETTVRTTITNQILNFTKMQFDLSQVTSYINQKIGDTTAVTSLIRNELLDGSIATSTMDLDQALYEYISSAQILNELPLSAYNQPIGTDSAEIPFYYIQRNGLNALRTGVKTKADLIYQDYKDRIDYYRKFAIITMAVAIAFIGIAQFVMLPKIFSVNRTNTKVLALFGFIPPEEVGELAEKCERYMVAFLDEISAKREDSYYESEGGEEDLERSQQLDNGSKGLKRRPSNMMESQEDSLQQNYTVQMKEFSYKEDIPHMKVKNTASQLMIPDQESAVQITNKSMDEDKSFGTPLNKKSDQMEKSKDAEDIPMNNNDGKPKEKKEEEEEDYELFEFLQERSKKLKSSKDNNRGMVVIQLMAICFGIIAYFLGDFFHERNFLIRFEQGLDHLQVISLRSPNMKYVLLFSTEEVAEDNLAEVYPDIDSSVRATDNYRIQYSNLIYSNQAQIKQTFQETFPDDFSNYLTTLLDYNNNDICALYYSNNPTYYQICVSAGGQQGLIQTEVTFVENLEAGLTQFYNTANRDDSTKIATFNSASFDTAYNIFTVVDSIYSYLIDDFLSAFQSYFSQMFILQKVKFLVFFFCILCGFVIIWLPYLGRLQRQIFRTKGLLNMIPMDMLKKNKILRETFTSNEILKAVQ